ncbi:MAG TPA: diguanylate cyclase, partial [Geobacteraceae bacterium]
RDFGLFSSLHEAGDGLQGFKALLANPVDLIICDLEMPTMDGFKFLALVQTREELRDIPVIMLTGRGDRELKIKGLEQGASDYVTKPFDTGELVARVKVQLKIKSLQDELKQSNQLLREMSITDHLTRLYNRRHLMEVLDREAQRARRKMSPLAIIIMDIDHFKMVNDVYGHQNGDEVLTAVAGLIRNELRDYDIPARYGGEEFIVVLPETSLQEAFAVAERIRGDMAALTFGEALKELRITASFGVSALPAKNVNSVESLIREADKALYRAKQGGRNRTEAMAQESQR